MLKPDIGACTFMAGQAIAGNILQLNCPTWCYLRLSHICCCSQTELQFDQDHFERFAIALIVCGHAKGN